MRVTPTPAPLRATDRTGPLGRLARLALASVAALSLASIVDQGGVVGFRNPSVLTEPSVWFLDAVMLVAFVFLVGQLAAAQWGQAAARRWQFGAVIGLGIALAVAALMGWALFGAVWGFPLADLVWAFDVLVLSETMVAVLFAIALGTPGCEIGVWPELIARARGERFAPSVGPACMVGLHLLDSWEAGHRWRSRPEEDTAHPVEANADEARAGAPPGDAVDAAADATANRPPLTGGH